MITGRDKSLILTYHRLFESDESDALFGASDNFYAVAASDFRGQLERLVQYGYKTILLEELLAPTAQISERSTIITFDDGYESDYSIALPLLCEFGFKAVFFICNELVGKPGYLAWDEVRMLRDAGMSVQSHGLYHRDLTSVPAKELLVELKTARESLQQEIGGEVQYISIPQGFVNGTVVDAARNAGFRGICTSVPGMAHAGDSSLRRFAIRRSTQIAQFENVLSSPRMYLTKAHLLYRVAGTVKNVIGVRRYEQLKNKVFS